MTTETNSDLKIVALYVLVKKLYWVSEVFKETLNEQERAELCDLFQDALRGGDLVGVFNMNCYIADE